MRRLADAATAESELSVNEDITSKKGDVSFGAHF
jgi:hypothetical protein